MADWTDRSADLADVMGPTGARLTQVVRQAMAGRPDAEASHHSAMDACADVLGAYLPVDEEGVLVNTIVAFVENQPNVTRVAQICAHFGLTERALQRLTRRRLGLTSKWLIQRRRLHEAADRLRQGSGNLAHIAADLGYADQPHFTHDFRTVTGMTPGEFATRFG
jgi:AraC-like DNA-binding protein